MSSPLPSARRRNLLFAFFMSCFMSLLMSAVITAINTGLDWGYFLRWGKSWVIAWAVAFPLVSFIAPLAQRLTGWVLRDKSPLS